MGLAMAWPLPVFAQGEVTPVRPATDAPLAPGPVSSLPLAVELASRRVVATPAGPAIVRLATGGAVVEAARPRPDVVAPGGAHEWGEDALWRVGAVGRPEWRADLRAWEARGLAAFDGRLFALGCDRHQVELVEIDGPRTRVLAEFGACFGPGPQGSSSPRLRSAAGQLWIGGDPRWSRPIYRMETGDDVPTPVPATGPDAGRLAGPLVVVGPDGRERAIDVSSDGFRRLASGGPTPLSPSGPETSPLSVVTAGPDRVWALFGDTLLSTDGTEPGTRSARITGPVPTRDVVAAGLAGGFFVMSGFQVALTVLDSDGSRLATLPRAARPWTVSTHRVHAVTPTASGAGVELVSLDPRAPNRPARIPFDHDLAQPPILWTEPQHPTRVWLVHQPQGRPARVRAFEDGTEVVPPVEVTPPHHEPIEWFPVAALDTGEVVLRTADRPLRFEIVDAETRQLRAAREAVSFLGSDGRAVFFSSQEPEAPVARWSRRDGWTQPLTVGPDDFAGVRTGFEGRPLLSVSRAECFPRCLELHQVGPDGRVQPLFTDLGLEPDDLVTSELIADERGAWLIVSRDDRVEVARWDFEDRRSRIANRTDALPPGVTLVDGDANVWRGRLDADGLRLSPLPTLTPIDIEDAWTLRQLQGTPSLIETGPAVWQLSNGRVERVAGIRSVASAVPWDGRILASAAMASSDGAPSPGEELVQIGPAPPRVVRDIWPGPLGSRPRATRRLPNESGVVFHAETPEHGRELWVSDGTSAGTRLACDVDPGPRSGIPSESGIAVGPDAVFVSALVPTIGAEVIRIPMPVLRGEVPCVVPSATGEDEPREDEPDDEPPVPRPGEPGRPLDDATGEGCGCRATPGPDWVGVGLGVLFLVWTRLFWPKRPARRR